jgi:hypothetical protein
MRTPAFDDGQWIAEDVISGIDVGAQQHEILSSGRQIRCTRPARLY